MGISMSMRDEHNEGFCGAGCSCCDNESNSILREKIKEKNKILTWLSSVESILVITDNIKKDHNSESIKKSLEMHEDALADIYHYLENEYDEIHKGVRK